MCNRRKQVRGEWVHCWTTIQLDTRAFLVSVPWHPTTHKRISTINPVISSSHLLSSEPLWGLCSSSHACWIALIASSFSSCEQVSRTAAYLTHSLSSVLSLSVASLYPLPPLHLLDLHNSISHFLCCRSWDTCPESAQPHRCSLSSIYAGTESHTVCDHAYLTNPSTDS